MEKTWLMGIDLGGSGARCTLVNCASAAAISTSGSWAFSPSIGTFGTGFDLDLELVWQVVGTACRAALESAGIDGSKVAALAVSSMRYSTVLLDADGNSVLAVPNRDARAVGECFDMAERMGEDVLQETGSWPMPMQMSARLVWFRKEHPQQFAQLHTAFGMGEWLNFRCCGERAIDPSQGSASGLFSLAQEQWNWALIDKLELPRNLFPPVLRAGSVLGTLTSEASAHLGLTSDTTVAMGGADTQCSLLGSNVIAQGACAMVAGTTAPVQAVLAQPVVDGAAKMVTSHHVVPGRWVLESNAGGMGEAITLMARILFPEAPQAELRLFAEAALGAPGAAGMLSTVGGDIMNMQSPTLPVGQIALSHLGCADDPAPRRHLARAIAEGCAYALRANIELVASTISSQPSPHNNANLTLCGGLSRSAVFAQLLANIVDLEIQVPQSLQTSSLGAAICAGLAAGSYPDFASACQALCGVPTRFQASADDAAVYKPLYNRWMQFREQAQQATAPVAADNLLPYVLKEPAPLADPACVTDRQLHALISASFDAASLTRLDACMDIKYASFREAKRLLTGPTLVQALTGKQIFVTEVDVLDASALAQLPELRVVAACRGDAVNVDVEACTAFGIPVIFAPGRNAIAVADLTVGFIISLARKLPAATQFLRDEGCSAGNMGKMGQAFGQLQGSELWHKTIGLVGLGAVGRAVAQRLAGFEVEILVADPFITAEQAALAGCRLTDLETLLRRSDFVSVHAAVTPATTGMIDADAFSKMKHDAYFINTARAALVDEQALIDALAAGTIAGAALDTFAVEPPGFDHPLVQHPNVISTPHSAGNTVEVANHQGDSVSTALLQLLRGDRPGNVLNPETLAAFSWAGPKPQPDTDELARLTNKRGPAVTDLQRDAKATKSAAAADTSPPPATHATVAPDVVEKMSAILQKFCAAMEMDPTILSFSADKDVTLCFNAHDLGLNFHIALHNGIVSSGLGAPPGKAEVQLEMRGEILDGMFTGTVDTMECAMNGEISFMGDAAKAMTLQHLNDDMNRLYIAARTEVGDPGDLSATEAPAPATAPSGGTRDVRDDLVDIMQELYESQVITATGGNISVRIPQCEAELWITPSRLFKGDLKPDVMVRINLEGDSLDTGVRSPSSEWCMHTRILERKPQATAVIHAHAPNATILANCGLPFLPISTEAAFFGNIPRVPFLMPGTPELADAVAEAMENEWAVLMINHGIIVAGRTLRRAADMVEIIERSAEVILGCYAVGKEPPVLPEDAAAHFRKLGDIVA